MSDKRFCVLLVEDDVDCAEELAELLDSYGMSVTVAHNLAQARDTAARQTFDVLLVDVGLGHERGLDLAQAWHCEGRFVVLLTGSAVPEADMRSFSDPAPVVMIKPVDVPRCSTSLWVLVLLPIFVQRVITPAGRFPSADAHAGILQAILCTKGCSNSASGSASNTPLEKRLAPPFQPLWNMLIIALWH